MSTQTPEANKSIARLWFAAFNAHDLESLLALYADTARHFSPKLKLRMPETEGWISGKDALRVWWADAFERLPSLQYFPNVFTADDARVVMEYTRKVEGEPDLAVAEMLEIKDAKIVESRVYHG